MEMETYISHTAADLLLVAELLVGRARQSQLTYPSELVVLMMQLTSTDE